MQRPLIPSPVRHQILPIHDIALNRPKRHARLILLVTVNEPAPPLVPRRIQDGKVGPAAGDVVGLDVAEEGADAVAAQRRGRVRRLGEPVGVEVVALRDGVLDQLDGLQVRLGHVEALEGEGARLDAAHDGVAGDGGGLGGADGVDGRVAAFEDGRVLEVAVSASL